jgi:O-antigen/teichoic acid export membrane protein
MPTLDKALLETKESAQAIAGRSGLRYRRIAISATAGITQKIITVGTGFISTPLVLRYLGKEQFGIWLAFMSFVSFLQFTDLGMGIGLQNSLTACDGEEDRVRPRRLISSALLLMIAVAALLIVGALLIVPSVPIDRIVRTATDSARGELFPSAQLFVIAFAIVLPLGLVQYICNAYQRSYLTSASIALANVIGFAGALIGIGLRLPLSWFIFIATLSPAPAYIIVGVTILRTKHWLRPAIRATSPRELRQVVRYGLPAFGAQAGGTLMLQEPTLAIASVLGAAAVGPFVLSQQLLSAVNIVLNVSMLPLWPAYGEAATRQDVVWIKRTFVRSVLASFAVIGPASVLVALFGRTIIQLWTGRPDIVPTLPLLMACNALAIVLAWNRACLMLLNGLGRMTFQACYGILLPVLMLALSFHFGKTVGAAGLVWIAVVFGEIPRGFLAGVEAWVALRALDYRGDSSRVDFHRPRNDER